jgi:hypothetical protein
MSKVAFRLPSLDSSAIMIQEFFIANVTGKYTFSTPVDKINTWGCLWVGENAYCDWTDENASFRASSVPGGVRGGVTAVHLTAGDALPLTSLWANSGGHPRSYLSIIDRGYDGTVCASMQPEKCSYN